MSENELSIGECATLACLLEVTAPKSGNVHRGADFEDLTFWDFVASAVAIGSVMQRAAGQSLGQTVLEAIRATRSAVATNTNLGTVLLIAPLAMVARGTDLADGIQKVLQGLDADDSRLVYEAIRLAEPGGLGKTDQHDIADPAPADLVEAMRTGAEHDLVARQYTNGFSQVFGEVVAWLAEGLEDGWALDTTILHVQMRTMSQYGDSLIARKCGEPASRQAAERAARVLESGTPQDEAYHAAMGDLDFWLRSDGHRRNPGTTADLIAAGLFVALREGIITRPVRMGIRG